MLIMIFKRKKKNSEVIVKINDSSNVQLFTLLSLFSTTHCPIAALMHQSLLTTPERDLFTVKIKQLPNSEREIMNTKITPVTLLMLPFT